MKRFAPVLVPFLLIGCSGKQASHEKQVVPVVVRAMQFEAPDEISSGWTTFRFVNESEMVHFALVERMPEGTGIVEQQEQVAPVFQEGMDLLIEGRTDDAMAAFGKLPEWFGEIRFVGGPGLTSPGRTSEATVHLVPGTYLLECYVKTEGVFHSYNPDPDVYGMVHEFRVTEESSGAQPPSADVQVRVSAARGIEILDPVSAGPQTIEVRFVDQGPHEHFVGHDVHLVRLADDTDLDALELWMDWSRPAGLQTPAPAVFVGGLNEMSAGATGYFHVNLEAGSYAWIAEVPGAGSKGMLQTFTVDAT